MGKTKRLMPRELERAIDLGRLGPLYINELDLRLEEVGLAVGPIRQKEPFKVVGIREHWDSERERWMKYRATAKSDGRNPELLMTWYEWINGRRYYHNNFTCRQEWTSRGIWVQAVFGWHEMIFDRSGQVRPVWWQSSKYPTFQSWLDSDLSFANKGESHEIASTSND